MRRLIITDVEISITIVCIGVAKPRSSGCELDAEGRRWPVPQPISSRRFAFINDHGVACARWILHSPSSQEPPFLPPSRAFPFATTLMDKLAAVWRETKAQWGTNALEGGASV